MIYLHNYLQDKGDTIILALQMESQGTGRTLLPNHFCFVSELTSSSAWLCLTQHSALWEAALTWRLTKAVELPQNKQTRRFGWLHHYSPVCINVGANKDPEHAGNVHSSKTGTFKTGTFETRTFKTGTLKTRRWFTLFLSSHNSCWREQVVHLRGVILFQTPASLISSIKHSFVVHPLFPRQGTNCSSILSEIVYIFRMHWKPACHVVAHNFDITEKLISSVYIPIMWLCTPVKPVLSSPDLLIL